MCEKLIHGSCFWENREIILVEAFTTMGYAFLHLEIFHCERIFKRNRYSLPACFLGFREVHPNFFQIISDQEIKTSHSEIVCCKRSLQKE